MVWVTGDMHGDESRLYGREWSRLKAGDTLIVCGDFGYIWNGDNREREIIEYLGSRKFNVCFVDGTHENFDRLNSYRVVRWKGGLAHRIHRHLYHLCRGEVFGIEGVKIFAFGGGESLDKDIRAEQNKWWREELPTPVEMEHGAAVLDELNCKVDYIVTHEPPSLVKSAMLLNTGDVENQNKLNGFFQTLDNECTYSHWYFGAMHEDRMITPKHTCVFNKIIPLGYKQQISGKKI